MPRPRKTDPTVQRTIKLPRSIAEEVDARLWDPFKQRRRFDALNKLITRLLRDWLADEKAVASFQREPSLDDLLAQGGREKDD